MRVLLAGAGGIIGQAMAPVFGAAGHELVGVSRSGRTVPGIRSLVADVLDPASISAAVAEAAPEAIVHMATAIPDPLDPKHIDQAMAATNRLRTDGTRNLIAAATEHGVGRFIAQSIAFAYDPAGPDICTEDQPLWADPPPIYAPTVAAIRDLEAQTGAIDGLTLRFGQLYGTGTSYGDGGGMFEQVRAGRLPIVGSGGSVFSFLHAADAASSVLAAVEGDASGVVNVVDDDPAPVHVWLPELARMLDARAPKHVPQWLARFAVGPFGVAFMTALRGADNSRARRQLRWKPRFSSWREGFPAS